LTIPDNLADAQKSYDALMDHYRSMAPATHYLSPYHPQVAYIKHLKKKIKKLEFVYPALMENYVKREFPT